MVVSSDTYPERYDSADVVEFEQAPELRLPGPLTGRHLDALCAACGLPRVASRRQWAPAIAKQSSWPPSVVVGHNAPQLVPLIDTTRHVAICHAHNQLLRSYSRRETTRVFGAAAAVFCVSAHLANELAEHLSPSLRDRVRVVPNGVDFAAFRRPRTTRESDLLRVVFVGRMIPEKGPHVLVEALRRLNRPDIRLTLIGSAGFDAADPLTSYERSLRRAVEFLGDRAEVKPFQPRDQVLRILQDADVTVVPSCWQEPFGLTVMEGMASGNAVIGSRIGGIPEALGGVGMLVRPGDPDDLAAALEALADDPVLLADTAAACTDYARTHDWAWASEVFHRTVGEFL